MLGKIGRWIARHVVASHERERPDPAKRETLRTTPLPDAWLAIVERELPHYRRMTASQRAKLAGDIQVFLGERVIDGIGGFVVDDRARVIVAASAALLVLGRDIAVFDHVERVVIRPEIETDDDQLVAGRYQASAKMLGDEVIEHAGVVELSWSAVVSGYARADGANTALHELAHAFDHADGRLDALVGHVHYDRWRAALRDLPLHEGILDFFTAELPGDVDGPELFAVATEVFFERPRKLHRLDPALFDALHAMYGIDPRTMTDR